MLLQKVFIKSRVVVIVVAARIGTGIERKFAMTRPVFGDVLVAVNTIIQRYRHAHGVRSLFLMFGVACQAVRGVDLLQQNGLGGVDEFVFGMSVSRFLQIGTVATDARLIGYTTVRQVASLATHFNLVVPMSGFAEQVN